MTRETVYNSHYDLEWKTLIEWSSKKESLPNDGSNSGKQAKLGHLYLSIIPESQLDGISETY